MNDEEPKTPKEIRKDRRREKRLRKTRMRKRTFVWTFFWLTVVVSFFGYANLSVQGRSLDAPEWLSTRIETRLNESFASGRVDLGRVAFEVDETGWPEFKFHNLAIFDGRGTEVARLNGVSTRFSIPALVGGRIEPSFLRLSGAQITVRRRQDGQFDLSFGGGGATSGTLPGVLDTLDELFTNEPLSNISTLDASGLTVTLEDGRSGRLWQITGANIQLKLAQGSVDYSASFELFNGTEELAKTVIGITTDTGSSAATMGVTFENAAARDIALQSPVLSFLGVLDAPIAGAVRVVFDEEGTLGSLAGTLEIGKGALSPSEATRPVRFDSGKAYFTFDPLENKLQFSEVSVVTGAAGVTAQGHAYLDDFKNDWPSTLLAQFTVSDLIVAPEDVFAAPVHFETGAIDFRLRLDPFTLDIGQVVLQHGDEKLTGKASVAAGEKGWEVSSDLTVNQITHERLLTLWPVALVPRTRAWLLKNVRTGLLKNITGAIRAAPGETPKMALGYQFEDADVQYLKTLPVIKSAAGYSNINNTAFSLVLEKGVISAPIGGDIDVAGSTMRIDDITEKPARAYFQLAGNSTATASLSLLNEPPFNVLKKTDYTPDLAKGRADFIAEFNFLMKKKILLPDVDFQVAGLLTDISSDALVAGRTISAKALNLAASPDGVIISGAVGLGKAKANIEWVQKFGPENAGKSTVTGSVRLSKDFVEEFSIGLPSGSVSGSSNARIELDLQKDQAPKFTLSSELEGVGLAIPPLGWSKSKSQQGQLVVEGLLGTRPAVSRLELSAAGLNASGGKVSFKSDGQMDTASFARVTAGGWLDAPVVLTGRGKGRTPAIALQGGVIDVRRTKFSGTGQSGGGPLNLTLDRLVISDGISLTGFKADLTTNGGLSGDFTGRVNGGALVNGILVPEPQGSAIRVISRDAGGVLKNANVLKNATGGNFDLILRPRPGKGVYAGTLVVKDTRVIGAPALAELISAISIVGLIDQLGGPGIAFSEVQAEFVLSPSEITLTQSSAVGPSLGVSLDGRYNLTNGNMDMQGVFSPVYFLNAIGQIFSRRGEGLFGFTFRLTGPAENPRVTVNPLSILTPGMFREIFRKPPPTASQ